MDRLQFEVSYEWQPVYLREKVEYQFPMAISPYMRTHYKTPAVFRWEVFQKAPGDKKIVYIGEAQELCPKRLYGYLNPGATQLANKKVNADFRGYLNEKLGIKLDFCRLQSLNFAGKTLGSDAVNDKYIRRLMVEATIIEHKNRGYTVIDL